jgi:uncharacterized protein YraI
MSIKSNLLKAGALGVVATALTAGAAFAAVATTSVNVRSGPGTSYGVVDTLRPGEPVSIRDRSGGWCAVSKSGPDGWVSCAYLAGGYGPRVNVYRDRPNFYRDRSPDIGFGFSFGVPGGHVSIGTPMPRHYYYRDRPWWY